MYEAYRQMRKSGAVGVYKVKAEEYAADPEANLLSLLDRFKSGTNFDPPVRQVQIPKGLTGVAESALSTGEDDVGADSKVLKAPLTSSNKGPALVLKYNNQGRD